MAEHEQRSVRNVTSPAGDPAWLVSDYRQVRSLLADPRLGQTHTDPANAARFSHSAIFGQPREGTPETERAENSRMRRMLARSFSARRMERLRPRITAMAVELLDELAASTPPADFHEAVSFPLPALVISELLGVPYEDRDDFRRWSDEAADLADGERSEAGLQSLFTYMGTLTETKRRQPAEDVISDLLTASDQDRPPGDIEVSQLAAGLLFAGHITSVNAIDEGVLLLLTHPKQRERLRGDRSLVPSAVEEILRYPTDALAERRANAGLPRWAVTDVEVGDVTIPSGDLVLLSLQQANFDGTAFPEPERFDVGRRENPHMSFGHGPHYCIGAPLARLELECIFGALFDRLPGLELAVPTQSLERRPNMLLGGLVELPVRW